MQSPSYTQPENKNIKRSLQMVCGVVALGAGGFDD